MYELLALRPAFDSSDRLSTISRITHEDPPVLRNVNRTIPHDLETIVIKAIDKEPKSRYASAHALAEDLNNFIHDLPIKARRHSLLERLVRWSRRNRGVAAALALALASLILLASVSTYSAITQSALRKESDSRGEQLAERGKELQAQSDVLQQNLYYAQMNLASAAAVNRAEVETVKARLASTHPELFGKDLRGWEWYYLKSLVNQEEEIWNERHWTWHASYSPDGTRIAYTVNGYGVLIRSTETGELIKIIETNGAHAVKWSPNGESIASSDYVGNVFVWDAVTFEEKFNIRCAEHKTIYDLSWSHDGSQLATKLEKTENSVSVWDGETGKPVLNIKFPDWIKSAAWSPVDNLLAISAWDEMHYVPWIIDAESGSVLAKLNSP